QFARDLESGSRTAKPIWDDLQAHPGRGLVVSDQFEATARRLNESLGNIGQTVDYASPEPGGRPLSELAADMRSGAVKTLIIVGGNPVYDAPVDLDFDQLLKNVRLSVHLDLYPNETAGLCHWHVPETHSLETWSDARAFE